MLPIRGGVRSEEGGGKDREERERARGEPLKLKFERSNGHKGFPDGGKSSEEAYKL